MMPGLGSRPEKFPATLPRPILPVCMWFTPSDALIGATIGDGKTTVADSETTQRMSTVRFLLHQPAAAIRVVSETAAIARPADMTASNATDRTCHSRMEAAHASFNIVRS
jgi:hypothetical protein